MKKVIYFIIVFVGSVFLASCGDFLEEYSNDLVYASSCDDLDEVLIGNGYLKAGKNSDGLLLAQDGGHYWPHLHLMDDDVEEYLSGETDLNDYYSVVGALRNFYIWAKIPWSSIAGDEIVDEDWRRLYQHIAYLNVIIASVDKFSEDPEIQRRRVLGEAQFLRGFAYYILINLYAPPYVEESSKTDLGVPLKVSEYVEDKYFSRAPVADVYAQIVADLQAASDNLHGIEQSSKYRVNEQAARTLLSRVYLYMGEWQLALNECDNVVKLGCPLMDLRSLDVSGDANTRNYFMSLSTPELFFTQGTSSWRPLMSDISWATQHYRVSDELMGLYQKYDEAEDLRPKAFFEVSPTAQGYYYVRKAKVGNSFEVADACILRGGEVYLNKAEAEAMLESSGAVQTLIEFMKFRYAEGKLPAINHLYGEELVKFIREERRRELCLEGHRWFDLRRYAVSPKYPEKRAVAHKVYSSPATTGEGIYSGTYVLNPYGADKAWVLPIPAYEIEFDRGNMIDNPTRDERKMK